MVETNSAERQMVVAHKPIGNYMPAMTMPFRVGREVDLERLTPGTRVEFELNVGKKSSVAQKVRVIESKGDVVLPKAPVNQVLIGQKMASFSLIDQTGKAVSLSDFAGKVVVVDFIYTRCPLAGRLPESLGDVRFGFEEAARCRVSVDHHRSAIRYACSVG